MPVPQSHLRFPLTRLLGTDASVRVLRELALHGEELTTTLLARRTGITDQSVRNAVATLGRAGVLKTYGQGRAVAYQLDAGHPVAQMLITLFRAEDRRVRTINDSVRHAAEQLEPQPLAVWMFGSAARHQDDLESDLDLLLIVEDASITDHLADVFRDALADIEAVHRLTISVVPLSADDVVRLAREDDPFWRAVSADAVVLQGPRPESLVFRLRPSPAALGSRHG
jgi:predicted nucleotidyltransferase